MDLVQQLERDWKRNQLICKGDHIIVGVSGGADSVCLLAVLSEVRIRWDLTIMAVHVNHSIRKETAVRDADFVKQLCEKLGISCQVETVDVPRLAKENGLSVEEAGRIARYDTFERIRRECGANKIAVAHHLDDNAETILFQLIRGSGLRGMGGMEEKRGRIIRPLLSLTRKQIENWLLEKNLAYVTDETNLVQEYTRNKIRLTVLPYLEQQISEKVREHIVNCGKLCLEADNYFVNEAEKWLEQNGEDDKAGTIEIKSQAFEQLHPALKKYVIRQVMEKICGRKKDISYVHVEEVIQLFQLPVGKSVNLPEHMYAKKTYEKVKIGRCNEKMEAPEMEIGKCHMILEVFPYKKNEKIPENTYTKWFDYDTIKNTVSLRSRISGDKISVVKGGKKKLKDYMIDAKIPREWRDKVPLVADGNQILWVVGYRIGDAFKVTKQTEKILQITIQKDDL